MLSSGFAAPPFILMVEGASIDKQSHPNQAAGTIWDTIEFDKAIGVARAWAAKRPAKDTLIVVTADHDQSMSIIGVSNTPDTEYFDRNKSEKVAIKTTAGDQDFTVWGDSFSNARAGLPFVNTSTTASNNGGAAGHARNVRAGQSSRYAVDQHLLHLLRISGIQAGCCDGLSGELRRGHPPHCGGFRTGDHTGSSVPVTAEGPGAFLFTGYMDQTDIFFKMAAPPSHRIPRMRTSWSMPCPMARFRAHSARSRLL